VWEGRGGGATPPPSPPRQTRTSLIGYRGILLTPGDSPGITPALVRRVLERFRDDPHRIIIPTHGGRRGHPVALPWALAALVRQLPPGVGINALVAAHADRTATMEWEDAGAVADLDTPEDYRRWSPS
jgi:molybdenum cofactor cytidylyltransferase